MSDNFMDDYEFIRLLAERAQFTVKDTKILWDNAKEIISENIDKKREMCFRNFITIKFINYERNQWDEFRKKHIGTHYITRISVKFSKMKREYEKRKKNAKSVQNEKIS